MISISFIKPFFDTMYGYGCRTIIPYFWGTLCMNYSDVDAFFVNSTIWASLKTSKNDLISASYPSNGISNPLFRLEKGSIINQFCIKEIRFKLVTNFGFIRFRQIRYWRHKWYCNRQKLISYLNGLIKNRV